MSVMTSYNAVNGRFTSEDPELILGLLREECGFKGFVMTDWNSYDTADVVRMARAGVSWITPGSNDDTFIRPLVEAMEEGSLSQERMSENVYRLLAWQMAMGKRERRGGKKNKRRGEENKREKREQG